MRTERGGGKGSLASSIDGATRREFLQSAAVRSALVTLFGGMSLDALTEEVQQAARRNSDLSRLTFAARRAAADAQARGVYDPHCLVGYACGPTSVYCVEHSCGSVYGCTVRDLTCENGQFTCPTTFNCTPEHHECAPYYFTCAGLYNPNYG